MNHPEPMEGLAQGHQLTVGRQLCCLHLDRAASGQLQQPESAVLRGSQQAPPAAAAPPSLRIAEGIFWCWRPIYGRCR